MEWIHDEFSVVVKHAQTMLQLVKFGIDWKCGELEQIVNIPVTQIVEEITEVNIPVTQIVEEITEVNIPVPQIVDSLPRSAGMSLNARPTEMTHRHQSLSYRSLNADPSVSRPTGKTPRSSFVPHVAGTTPVFHG